MHNYLLFIAGEGSSERNASYEWIPRIKAVGGNAGDFVCLLCRTHIVPKPVLLTLNMVCN